MTEATVTRHEPWKVDRNVNMGTMIHLVVLATTILFAWASFDKRTTILEMQFQEQSKTMQNIASQTNRIERYLMSQDKQYWKKTYADETK